MGCFTTVTLALLAQGGLAVRDTGPEDVVPTVERTIAAADTAALRRQWTADLESPSQRRLTRLRLATLHLLTYRYGEAEEHLADLRAGEPPDAIAAWATYLTGRGHLMRGRLEPARSSLRAARALAGSLGDTTLAGYVAVDLAAVLSRTAGAAAALAPLAAVDSLRPKDAGLRARATCLGAALRAGSGDFDPAPFQDAIAAAAGAGDLRAEAGCLQAYARALAPRAGLDSAGVLQITAIERYRAAGDLAGLATALQWAGWAAYTVGSARGSGEYLAEAVALAARVGSDITGGWAEINLAQLALSFGDMTVADRHLDRAEALLERAGDAWGLRTARQVRTTQLAAIGAYDAAASRLRDALDSAATGLSARFFAAYQLAAVRAAAEDLAGAETALAEARRAMTAAGLDAWSASVDLTEAHIALRRGQPAAAARLLDGAATAFHPTQASVWYTVRVMQALAAVQLGDDRRGVTLLTEAREQLDLFRSGLTGLELRRYVFQQGGPLRIHEYSLARAVHGLAEHGYLEHALVVAEWRRARELQDRLTRAAALDADSTPWSAHAAPPTTTLATLRGLVDGSTAFLEYVTGPYDAATTAFVVTLDTVRTYRLPPVDSLAPPIADFLAALERGAYPDTLGRALGAALLDPVLRDLPAGVSSLTIAPDGILHRLPFEALRLADGRHAVERFTLSYVPSGAAVAALRRRSPETRGQGKLLALGDPAFGAEEGTAGGAFREAFQEAGGLLRLRASRGEARRVARYAADPTVRLGQDASEAFLKSTDLTQYGVVHLATHALVDEGSVRRTAVALARGDGEDGFLSVSELARLRLAADLVVLSGCRTAGGRVVAGEGLLGLTGPLLAAGARAVVGTRWAVEDQAIRRIVLALYEYLAEGKPVPRAVSAVQRDLIAEGAPPSEWAVLAAVGDPASAPRLRKPPWWRFW